VPSRPSKAIGYVVAFVVTTLTFFARDYLEGVLGDRVPLLPFVFAVIVSAWYGGLGPGLFSTLMGALLAERFFLQPRFSLPLSPAEIIGLVFFVLAGTTASWLFEALHAAHRRVELERERSRRAEDALREAGRHKDEFIAILAHELRTPLAPISNALEILRRADGDARRRAAARDMMERHTRQIGRLVEDLLDMNRIARGTLSLRTARVELHAVLERALEMSQPALAAGRHQVVMSLPPQPMFVEADAARLAQVFCNLLNNAAKYTSPGGRIEIGAEQQAGSAVVRVRDNGSGIPKEMLSRIFEMFTQLGERRASAQSGLGIGLTIVKRLVELHGGSVEATSEGPGRGSEFAVRLPVAAPRAALPEDARERADVVSSS
jgi:signal transduction histidine kinase